MSNSDRDSGSWMVIAGLTIALLVGVGLWVYRTSRIAQQRAMLAIMERDMARLQASLSIASLESPPEDPTATGSPDSAASDPLADENSIRGLMLDQQADWNQGDLDAFMKVYWQSEQLTFSAGGKTTRGWQATLDRYKQKYSTKEQRGELTFSELEFQRLAPDVMLVLGNWQLARGDNSAGGNFSLVWKKWNDRWTIIHDHSSSLAP